MPAISTSLAPMWPAIRATASCRPTSATARRCAARLRDRSGRDAVMHLAAESHVDRSIDGPGAFIDTNVVGTYDAAGGARRPTGARLGDGARQRFRFLHVSTDEVYGSLGRRRPVHRRRRAYEPELALFRAARRRPTISRAPGTHTYGLPVIIIELLEQLRALSLSREADPADHPQRARRQAAAGLRRRRQRARLAVRRGSRARALTASLTRGKPGENLQCRRRQRAHQHRRRQARSATSSIGCAPRGAAGHRAADQLRHRPARPRPRATRSTLRKLERELGWRRRSHLRGAASTRRCAGISTIGLVVAAPRRQRYGGERLGLVDALAH